MGIYTRLILVGFIYKFSLFVQGFHHDVLHAFPLNMRKFNGGGGVCVTAVFKQLQSEVTWEKLKN